MSGLNVANDCNLVWSTLDMGWEYATKQVDHAKKMVVTKENGSRHLV